MYLEDKKAGEAEKMAHPDLIAAADFLEHHTWIQGFNNDGMGGFCLLGALREAIQWPDYMKAVYTLYDHLNFEHKSANNKELSLAAWNDRCERTKEEVIQFLRNTAKG